MTTVKIKEWSSWDQAWQEMQKDKQPHGEKVIQKWNSRAQTNLEMQVKTDVASYLMA